MKVDVEKVKVARKRAGHRTVANLEVVASTIEDAAPAKAALAAVAGNGANAEISSAAPVVREVSLDDPSLYMNREISLLEFQKRVLEEARDTRNKLLERVKFLSIVCSNLDEFFMVRVAALKQKLSAGNKDLSIDGKTVSQQLTAVRERLDELMQAIYDCFQKQLVPGLQRQGIEIVDYSELNHRERAAVDRLLHRHYFPGAYAAGFRYRQAVSAYFESQPESGNRAEAIPTGGEHFARLKVPQQLPQLVVVPQGARGKKTAPPQKFVWIEQVIAANLRSLFPGLKIVESHPFHVTRDAEVAIKEIESDDLLETVEEAVWRRRFRKPVRLQTDAGISDEILENSGRESGSNPVDVFRVHGPLDLTRLRQLPSLDRPELSDKPLEPFNAAGVLPPRRRRYFHCDPARGPPAASSFQTFPPIVSC